MSEFWNKIFLGNTLLNWGIALSIMAGAFILLRIFKSIILKNLKKWSARTDTSFDDFIAVLIERSLLPFAYCLAVYGGLNYLQWKPKVQHVLHVAILVVGVFFIIRMITSLINYSINRYVQSQTDQLTRQKQARGMIIIINILVWILGIIFLIDNLGYNVTTIITGLGIGGIAIALAAQAILGDLFSYFVIFFDKPFETGDFITVDDKMGSIEYVGIKTTRIRALSGEQLIFSNTDLTNARVHNYKRMEKRRVVFTLQVEYQTPLEKLKQIPAVVKQIIEKQGDVQVDRIHFASFGESSLNYEIVYYVLNADFNNYMDKQQAINLQLFEYFQQEDIGFAYPTQTLYWKAPVNTQQQEIARQQPVTARQ